MIGGVVSRLIIIVFGTLYPAYASYKAVRTKNIKEYVKWMMYWIVFALFICIETVTDIFLAWFPFYYEIKAILVIWLLSPATKGSSTLYRKFVHPALTRREQEIDEFINNTKQRGYTTVVQLGTKGLHLATDMIMQTAIKCLTPALAGIIVTLLLPFSSTQNSQRYGRRNELNNAMMEAMMPRAAGPIIQEIYDNNNANVNFAQLQQQDEPDYGDDEDVQMKHLESAARVREAPARKSKRNAKKKPIIAIDDALGAGDALDAGDALYAADAQPKKLPRKTNAVRGRRRLRDITPDSDWMPE